MKLSHFLKLMIFAVIFAYSAIAAARIEIEGSISFQRQGNQVEIEIGRIANYSQTYTTGTLHVRLFARTSPEPFGQGHWITDINLYGISNGTGQLPPNTSFTDLRLTGEWQTPPDGTYYIHLIVTEHPNTDTALNTRTFNETFTFGDPTVPPILPPPILPPPTSSICLPEFSNCNITLDSMQFDENGNTANFSYQVRNARTFASDQWFASFFVCDQFAVDICEGNIYILGESQRMQGLTSNGVSEVLSESFDISNLPAGTYYPIVQIYHYTGTCIVDGYCVDFDTRYSQYLNQFVFTVDEPTTQSITRLQKNDVMADNVSQNQWKFYQFDSTANTETVTVQINNLNADADLYVNLGDLPTTQSHLCASNNGGSSTDSCTVNVDGVANILIGVFGYENASFTIDLQTTEATPIIEPPTGPTNLTTTSDGESGGGSAFWLVLLTLASGLFRKCAYKQG